MGAVLEYLCAEVVELAGLTAKGKLIKICLIYINFFFFIYYLFMKIYK